MRLTRECTAWRDWPFDWLGKCVFEPPRNGVDPGIVYLGGEKQPRHPLKPATRASSAWQTGLSCNA